MKNVMMLSRFLLLASFFGVQRTIAGPGAIGSELLLVYYTYRMEILPGIPPKIAAGCVPRSGNMCGFSDLVRYVMDGTFVNKYQPAAEDDTTTPSDGNTKAIDTAVGKDKTVMWKAEELIGSDKVGIRDLMNAITASVQSSVATGRATVSDLNAAIAATQQGMIDRAVESAENIEAYFREFLPGVYDYLEPLGDNVPWFDWTLSQQNVDAAVEAGTINQAQGETFKKQIQDFSKNFTPQVWRNLPSHPVMSRTLYDNVRTHLLRMQYFNRNITKWSRWVVQAADDGVIPASVCDATSSKVRRNIARLEKLSKIINHSLIYKL